MGCREYALPRLFVVPLSLQVSKKVLEGVYIRDATVVGERLNFVDQSGKKAIIMPDLFFGQNSATYTNSELAES